MSKGVYVALSGAVAQEAALETTATNVANATNAGYQRVRPVFREALARAARPDPNLRYAASVQTAIDTAPGATHTTGRPLDVALPRGAYLAVTSDRGERYTRAGALSVDASGTLKASGTPLASEDGAPIAINGTLPARIDEKGNVFQGETKIAQLRIVTFERPDRLQHEGGDLLAADQAGAPEKSEHPIVVGALEESNGSVVTAMTELMATSRSFEAFQKMIDAFGEADRKVLTTVPEGID